MATVSRGTAHVEETVVVEKKFYSVSLSEDEALSLALVLGRVGGFPTTTRRGDVQPIFDALVEAGVPWEDHYENSGLEGRMKFL